MIAATIGIILLLIILPCIWVGHREISRLEEIIKNSVSNYEPPKASIFIAIWTPITGAFLILYRNSPAAILSFHLNFIEARLSSLPSSPQEYKAILQKVLKK